MSCILMHSDYDAFMCIILHKFVFQFTTVHAQQCDKNRNIKAKDIGNIATKMGCPEEKTTKIAKLMWICTEYLHDPHGYN